MAAIQFARASNVRTYILDKSAHSRIRERVPSKAPKVVVVVVAVAVAVVDVVVVVVIIVVERERSLRRLGP